MKSQPITFRPTRGGMLMSSLSTENIGAANYTIKRNMRRKLERELRSEGFAKFCPKMFDGVIPMPASADDITLAIMLRHPNGRTAVIVGTATTIWKYAGIDDPLYVLAGYIAADYFVDVATAWKVIGTGFSASGRRWEAVQVNGYLVLNNAVNLPLTYRLTDEFTVPIYELRELGVASVGTIAIFNTVLFCFDIRQIKESKMLELMSPISSSVNAFVDGVESSAPTTAVINSGVAGVAGNTITATGSTFNSGAGFVGMVGRKIRMLNGVERTITAVTSATVATLDGAAVVVEPTVRFYIPRSQAFLGYQLDYAIQPRYADIWPSLNIAITPENPRGVVGLKVWWDSGESAIVTGIYEDFFTGDRFLMVSSDTPIPSGPCKIEQPTAYEIYSNNSFIDRIQWRSIQSLPDKPRRFGSTYPATITPTSNTVLLDYPVKSVELNGGDVLITGMEAGNLPAKAIYSDGLRFYIGDNAVKDFYQAIIDAAASAADLEALATTVLASTRSTLLAANEALQKANEASTTDPEDADLSAAAATASAAADAAQKNVTDAEAALALTITASDEADAKLATSESVEIQLADAVSSISRINDLQDDGSAILRALTLRNVLVIYKETAIFLCRQSGTAFVFSPPIEIPDTMALFYRNTLISVNGMYHLYAAENQFCQFDMTNQVPVNVPLLQACQDDFFDEATPDNMEKIFAADNAITSEVYFAFPSSGSNRAIAYEYEFNTVATSSIPMTAGATVTFPGYLENIFLIGGAAGLVWRYGLVAGKVRLMAGTASKTLQVVTASSGVFAITDIGKTIKFANGLRFGITSFTSATTVVVVGSGTVTAQAFSIEPRCYHHDESAYTSTLQSGGDGFGNLESQKTLNRHDMMLSGFSPNTEVGLTIRSGRSPNEVADQFGFTVVPPQTLSPAMLRDYLIGDRLEIAGINNPIEITGRTFNVAGVSDRGFGRRKDT